ncbi:archaellin/type IV pilin N-terminal domain-containing protein [Methanosarcina mazei]|uniref:Flagellin n=2 Tax=Methanosarcina mazei TaxID=2209 RepID=A0A0E3LTT5_METMZ|nr:archaellin/type IV pilin N-terminal domain-containing protein [Methanosarcina mazei]AAM30114.1 Flagillin B1 [Methanosarcina mazei Go1]AKB64081.1 Flagellin FlaB1 [Methanosarcina mazei S-6]WIM43688.1 flagellin [Methanosarcina mazei]WIM47145.1 flagellin [Methanosarcina mazei]
MKGIFSIFRKDDKAFTGLESAIVLTAFVVVAAVFSYVVLGAGFTTSDTAKKTIDEGVKQTTSSVELAGDVIANSADRSKVDTIVVTLQLTAGQSPVDIGADSNAGMLVVAYADNATYNQSLSWTKDFVGDNDKDAILEQHEKVQLTLAVPSGSMLQGTSDQVVNREFKLEIKPKIGAIVPITRVTPPQLDKVMVLK